MDPKKQTVEIVFDDALGGFKIHALDGKPVLEGPAGRVIESKGFLAYSDGHGGLYAIVMAPKEEHTFLESLFHES